MVCEMCRSTISPVSANSTVIATDVESMTLVNSDNRE